MQPPGPVELTPVHLRRPSPRVLRRRLQRTIRTFGPRLGPLVAQSVIGREVTTPEIARQVRRSFAQLGATYVKLGQLVASAPGVFGPEVSSEFRTLLDSAHVVSLSRVEEVIRKDLGRPVEEVFASFDPTPIGCASIAVVHRATLRDGRDVAVKVTRPGIRRKIAADLAIMGTILPRLATRLSGGDASLVAPLLSGLREQLSEELDLRNEARTMDHFRALIAEVGLDGVMIPEVIAEASGERVLTMELLDGVPIDDLEAVEALGLDPTPLLSTLVRTWFLTTARDGVFHGDVHAGNLLLLRDGRMAILDWGILGRLEPETHEHFRSIISAALGDEEAWTRVTTRVAEQIGPILTARMGIAAEDVPLFVRRVVEPLLTAPFGEVQLSTLFLGPDAGEGPGLGFLRRDVPSGDVPAAELPPVEFDRGMFLLVKQLLYFERYGKMYLGDVALLDDREFFSKLVS